MVGGFVWLTTQRAPSPERGDEDASASNRVGSAASSPARLAGSAASSVAAAPLALPAASAAGRDDPADFAIPSEGLEFCGVARVSAAELRRWRANPEEGRARAAAFEAQTQRLADEGVARIAARLAAGNEFQQVAARILMGDVDGAALMAARSSDALAYQLALRACGPSRDAQSACGALNAQRWAALAPSDARPWLRLLAEAHAAKDAVGVDAALAEAAARPSLSRGDWLLESLVVPVVDAAGSPAVQTLALVNVIGRDAAMVGTDMFAVIRVCKGQALDDVTRLGQCRAIARQLLQATSDMMEASLAQQLADRIGVPRDQQAHDEATLNAALKALADSSTDVVGFDWGSMAQMKKLSVDRAAHGDLRMALKALPPR